jgi:ribosomal protein L29
MLTLKELRKLNSGDLQIELKKAREESLKAMIPVRMGQDKKTTEAKKKQRYVAQILTIMNQSRNEETPQAA